MTSRFLVDASPIDLPAYRRANRLPVEKRALACCRPIPGPAIFASCRTFIERAFAIVSETDTLAVEERWLLEQPGTTAAAGTRLGDDLLPHERARVEAALTEAKGRVSGRSGAAARLGIPRSTLESKIRSLGIDKHRFKGGAR